MQKTPPAAFCQKNTAARYGQRCFFERIQSLWHLRTIHALRFALLRIFAQGGPHLLLDRRGRFHLLHQRGEQLRQLLCGQLLCHYSS